MHIPSFFSKNTQSEQNWVLSRPYFFYFYFWIGSVAEGNTTFFFSWPKLNSVVPCVQQNETYHSTMHTLFRHTQVFASHYDRVCIKADLDLYLIILKRLKQRYSWIFRKVLAKTQQVTKMFCSKIAYTFFHNTYEFIISFPWVFS